MISKLLVANRGEIARRIFRTCREMGIRTVAVFSDTDRNAPFVSEADEAYSLGGHTANDSYLRIDLIVRAAQATGADAVHPGYGFLAENPDFATAIIDAGLIWVGPPPGAIETMGSKLASKRLAAQLGIPVLESIEVTDDDIHAAAARIGWPVLVKASAGGGGKGMRIVTEDGGLDEALEGAKREAASAFGDNTVFLEKYLEAPHHIEIQVFADEHGNVTSLYERDCSIQRRYQKIIEEAPSPAIDEGTRAAMSAAAVKLAESVRYVGAGTVEFVFQDGDFFFLEMNTRLQVEHPVTEEITGLDLVAMQLKVASGEPLVEAELHPSRFGHAIEARLYAEDPQQGYLPASGTIDRFYFPEFDRVEAGVEDGSHVSEYYDPMIAKVIAWGETRDAAARRLAYALEKAQLHGITTNRDLLVRILRHDEFIAGDTDTHFLDRHDPSEMGAPLPSFEEARLAAVAAALAAQEERRLDANVHIAVPSGWRNSPSQLQETTFSEARGEIAVGYRFDPRRGWTLEVDGEALEAADVIELSPQRVGLTVDSHLRWFNVHRVGEVHHVDGPTGYTRLEEKPRFPTTNREFDLGSLHAPLPGKVVKVAITEGDLVEDGQVLVVLEAMKMEHSLRAPHAGTATTIHIQPGDQVEAGQVLVSLA